MTCSLRPPCVLPNWVQHDNRVQKLAAQKLAARRLQGAGAAQHAAAEAGAQQAPRKEAPLLFDLVYGLGDAELCFKVTPCLGG